MGQHFYEETEEAFTQLVSISLKRNPSAEEIFKMQSVLLRGGENITAISTCFMKRPFQIMFGFQCLWSSLTFRKIAMDQSWRTIVRYEGDTVHADDTMASGVLEKKLI